MDSLMEVQAEKACLQHCMGLGSLEALGGAFQFLIGRLINVAQIVTFGKIKAF
ncbi:MAG TPA: hypothetical protein GXX53_05555 [Tissierellia bacterium]|nr:hypothetical protein [Tissierellia bacterium]